MSIVDYKSPEELVAFLRTNPPKAKGQFAIGEGRCCIGHYADLCGLSYDPSDGGFLAGPVLAGPGEHVEPVAPPDHWLFDRAPTVDSSRSSWGLKSSYQVNLITLNDSTDTFAEVIDYLENVVIGGRS